MSTLDPAPLSPTERFTNRVDDYIKYRPGYPAGIVDLLVKDCGMGPDWVVADIGSGPGNLSTIFLANGNLVIGVEPNDAMRRAGERLLAEYPNFRSAKGAAEATTLATGSVHLITAGQAFHWFKQKETREEFRRILKPGGWVALIWNDRDMRADRLSSEYERILSEMAPEYPSVRGNNNEESEIAEFFGHPVRRAQFSNSQTFDLQGFLGRMLSSSYVPQAGSPGHEAILEACRKLFEEEQQGGKVSFLYKTEVFYGQL